MFSYLSHLSKSWKKWVVNLIHILEVDPLDTKSWQERLSNLFIDIGGWLLQLFEDSDFILNFKILVWLVWIKLFRDGMNGVEIIR